MRTHNEKAAKKVAFNTDKTPGLLTAYAMLATAKAPITDVPSATAPGSISGTLDRM